MIAMLLAGLVLGAVHEQPLCTFYRIDRQAAVPARGWTASSGSGIRMVHEGDRTAIELALPFAREPGLPRAYVDRQITADLAALGEFSLEVAATDPAGIGQLSLYFKSGDGWYAAGTGLQQKGWHVIRLSKASFRVEGRPAGWNRIDGVRIAAWRGAARDCALRIGPLAALWHDVAVVIPAAAALREHGEGQAAAQAADLMADMLAAIGLGSDAVDEQAVAHGALKDRRAAILAYNPLLADETAAALERFVGSGGKLLACYQLPPRLQAALGFGKFHYVRPERPEQLAAIRFDAPDVPGLPPAVRQASWNITAAEPLAYHARVIGQWYDSAGRPAGQPAMLLSDRGAFFSHIFLADDAAGKRQLLAAVLGKLVPELWADMAHAQQERAGRVGYLPGTEAVAAQVRASGNAAAVARLDRALETLHAAGDCLARNEFPAAAEKLHQARGLLVEAYLRAEPGKAREGRAFWNHSGTGAYPGDWHRTAKELARAGFNMIVPNMLWAGRAHYASDVLPRSETFAQYGDQVAQCVAAAHHHGLEVHVWKVNYNLSGAPGEFVARLRREGRTQVSAAGGPIDWLCPSHPLNFRLELDSMLEVARKYEVDGLHFDYIRYPDGEHCYCQGCRSRFEADSGRKVINWPHDCSAGPRREEYGRWRCAQITRLVEVVSREAKQLRPGIKISAAVFGAYPSCRQSVGQDWVAWVRSGYLDFLCPMDYTESDLSFAGLVAGQLELVGARVPVYPGIGATASRSSLTPDQVLGQIRQARGLGAAGFTIFNLDRETIGSIAPAVGLGAGSLKATPPHRPITAKPQ